MKAILIAYSILSFCFLIFYHPYRSEAVMASRPHRKWFLLYENKAVTYEFDFATFILAFLFIFIGGILLSMFVKRTQ